MEKTEYVRCPKCSFIYNQEQGKCPNCGHLPQLDESKNNEPVFNIND